MTLNIPSYIIAMQGVPLSELLAQDCIDSAKKFGIIPEIFPATHGNQIETDWKQHNLKEFKIAQRIKKINSGLIGCLLSHLRLWKKCVELQKPILIFEHDALVIKTIPENILEKFEDVCNLDYLSRLSENYDEEVLIDRGYEVKLFKKNRPCVSGYELYNKTHIKGAHAYIIKPLGAQKLIDFVWAVGALAPDVIINSVSCLLHHTLTSYCRINPKFWNSKRKKANQSFCRPTKLDKTKQQ
jgi:GR25 family glycosyltransferase involved in LPS biosynthesis